MKKADEIKVFLNAVGIAATVKVDCIEVSRDDVENMGGEADVLAAIRNVYGKSFFWDGRSDHAYWLKSVY